MRADSFQSGTPCEWRIAPGAPVAAATLAALFLQAGTEVPKPGRPRVLVQPGIALQRAIDAEWHNKTAGANLPKWLRRLARPQGRIDRYLCVAMEELAGSLAQVPCYAASPNAAVVADALWRSRLYTHKSRGGQIRRRLFRRQDLVNRGLVEAIWAMGEWIADPANGLVPPGGKGEEYLREMEADLKKASYLTGLFARYPGFLRRMWIDQFEVNLCLARAVQHAAKILLP